MNKKKHIETNHAWAYCMTRPTLGVNFRSHTIDIWVKLIDSLHKLATSFRTLWRVLFSVCLCVCTRVSDLFAECEKEWREFCRCKYWWNVCFDDWMIKAPALSRMLFFLSLLLLAQPKWIRYIVSTKGLLRFYVSWCFILLFFFAWTDYPHGNVFFRTVWRVEWFFLTSAQWHHNNLILFRFFHWFCVDFFAPFLSSFAYCWIKSVNNVASALSLYIKLPTTKVTVAVITTEATAVVAALIQKKSKYLPIC